MKLQIGTQSELGPVPTNTGFESITTKVLISLLGLLYHIDSHIIYDEVFEILRMRGVFQDKNDVIHEPF